MLNTQKLLYILPDVTYVAELLPGKKEHTFAIQTFRQINGEFINEDEEFLPDNIEKLFSKIEPDTYRLILPDFLFTNTILEVKETSESKVKQYIKDELLPKLGLSKDTHEIAAFILTQYGSVTKVQLTAIEKEVLNAVITSAAAHNIKIDHLHPLTWTIKSVISLEPSISVIQIGSLLYTSEHYIGVDQCVMSPAAEIENVIDTIKTLKGAQPSIQTVYLLTNSLVEEKLKEHVSKTLPVQQLATFKEEDTQMPSYVKQIIESGMKTLDIPDFSVPSFALPKEPIDVGPTKTDKTPVAITEKTEDEETDTLEPQPQVLEDEELPDKSAQIASASTAQVGKLQSLDVFDDEEVENDLDLDDQFGEESSSTSVSASSSAATATSTATTASLDDIELPKPIIPSRSITSTSAVSDVESATPDDNLSDEDDTIAQFASHSPATSFTQEKEIEDFIAEKPKQDLPEKTPISEGTLGFSQHPPQTATQHHVIKNPAGSNNLMKMAFVTLVVFALTVAVGVGIGFGILSLGNQAGDIEIATASPSPIVVTPIAVASPLPSPSASPSAAIDKTKTNILVVNATTKAGYAGTTTTKLKADGYTQVTARNARGEYEAGIYVLMSDEDPTLITALSAATDLELEFATGKTTEDPSNQYTAVIVLAE